KAADDQGAIMSAAGSWIMSGKERARGEKAASAFEFCAINCCNQLVVFPCDRLAGFLMGAARENRLRAFPAGADAYFQNFPRLLRKLSLVRVEKRNCCPVVCFCQVGCVEPMRPPACLTAKL